MSEMDPDFIQKFEELVSDIADVAYHLDEIVMYVGAIAHDKALSNELQLIQMFADRGGYDKKVNEMLDHITKEIVTDKNKDHKVDD